MPRPVVPMACSAACLVEAFLFHVVGEDDVGVVADDEVAADGDAGRAEVGDLFEEARRVDDDAVADDGRHVGAEDAGRQQGELEGAVAVDDGVAGVGAAVVADHEVVLVGEQIDDLALGLVAPLQADDTGAGHRGCTYSGGGRKSFPGRHKKRLGRRGHRPLDWRLLNKHTISTARPSYRQGRRRSSPFIRLHSRLRPFIVIGVPRSHGRRRRPVSPLIQLVGFGLRQVIGDYAADSVLRGVWVKLAACAAGGGVYVQRICTV